MQNVSRRTLAIVAKKYRWTRKTVIVCTYMCRFLVHVQTVSNLSRRYYKNIRYISNAKRQTPSNGERIPQPPFLFPFFHFVNHLSDRLFFYARFMNVAPQHLSLNIVV